MTQDLEQECQHHPDRDACPDAMIASVRGGYGLYVRDGKDGHAGSVIEIAYCPWCGTKLPPIGEIEFSKPPTNDA